MSRRILPICFIFFCTSVAWAILGGTIWQRTNASTDELRDRVQSVWGTPQSQSAPVATMGTLTVRPESSDLAVDLQLEYRQKGLLWYSTYKVSFAGDYEFKNSEATPQTAQLVLNLPAAQAVYDDLQFLVNGQPMSPQTDKDRALLTVNLNPGEIAKLHVGYRSQGLESWSYNFGKDISQVSRFHLRMNTNFKGIDFPDNTLAPTEKSETPSGWQLDWRYGNLLSGYEIALAMPQKTQPGPLASQISFFAPVSLFFFFFLMFMITTLRGLILHPMHYFFLACAFFSFHLLLAYLADHVDLFASFTISAAVSVFLVVSYLRLVTGLRFAIREAASMQFLYLVLFSFAFFFRGFTGLAITIGSILTLFVMMQMTAHVNWSEKFLSEEPPPLPTSNA